MKYRDLYVGTDSLRVTYPDKLMGPFPEVDLGIVTQTWRLFPCRNCREVTGYRKVVDDAEVSVCSEECLAAVTQNQLEVLAESEKEKIDITPVDVTEISDVQLVAPQSEQSSSTDGNQGVSNVEPLRSQPPVGEPS